MTSNGQIFIVNSCSFTILFVIVVFNSCLNDIIILELVNKVGATMESMVCYDSFGNSPVHLGVLFIKHYEQQVKTRKQ